MINCHHTTKNELHTRGARLSRIRTNINLLHFPCVDYIAKRVWKVASVRLFSHIFLRKCLLLFIHYVFRRRLLLSCFLNPEILISFFFLRNVILCIANTISCKRVRVDWGGFQQICGRQSFELIRSMPPKAGYSYPSVHIYLLKWEIIVWKNSSQAYPSVLFKNIHSWPQTFTIHPKLSSENIHSYDLMLCFSLFFAGNDKVLSKIIIKF